MLTSLTPYERVKSVLVLSAAFFFVAAGGSVIWTAHAVSKTNVAARQTLAGIQADIHDTAKQTTMTVQEVGKASATLRHNLTHLDMLQTSLIAQEKLFFGNAQDLLGSAQKAVDGLSATEATVNEAVASTTKTVNTSVADLTVKVGSNLDASRATLTSTNSAVQHFDALFTGAALTEILDNVNATAKHVNGISAHVENTTNDLEHKTHDMVHPSKRREVLNFAEDLINVSAHMSELIVALP